MKGNLKYLSKSNSPTNLGAAFFQTAESDPIFPEVTLKTDLERGIKFNEFSKIKDVQEIRSNFSNIFKKKEKTCKIQVSNTREKFIYEF